MREPPGGSGARQRRRWSMVAGLLALLMVGLVVLWVQAPALYGTTGEAKTAVATTRGAILTVLAALIAVTAAIATLAETQRANRESDQRDRYAKAIEQLGNDKLDVRLGGIYGLERIAETSERDQPIVVEVLAAFVREHSASRYQYIQAGRPGLQDSTNKEEEQRLADNYLAELEEPPVDVQAAATVLGSRRWVRRSNLRRAQLAGVQLREANFIGGNLTGANLSGADLGGANLSGADLGGANLTRAQLGLTDLTGADLRAANLSGADLRAANLSGARLDAADLREGGLTGTRLRAAGLTGADLVGANLTGADLGGANLICAKLGFTDLTNANLGGAKLTAANLGGADLAGASLVGSRSVTQDQLDSALGDVNTELPNGWDRPAAWRRA